jgi:hypothetical protein
VTTPQASYVTHVLDRYRTLPGTLRRVRFPEQGEGGFRPKVNGPSERT